jgi:hypothetical protein
MELWNSSQREGGTRVYIGTRGTDDTTGNGTTFGEIDAYGLLPN